MTAAEFTAFLDRHGWTQQQAAAELNTTQATISRWASEDPEKRRAIPGPVVRLIECLERERR